MNELKLVMTFKNSLGNSFLLLREYLKEEYIIAVLLVSILDSC